MAFLLVLIIHFTFINLYFHLQCEGSIVISASIFHITKASWENILGYILARISLLSFVDKKAIFRSGTSHGRSKERKKKLGVPLQ